MIKAAFQLVVLFALLAQSATTPLCIGDVGRQLTKQDIAALGMVLPTGAVPWLLNGEATQFLLSDYVEAYLYPTSTSSALRRGAMISVMRRRTPGSNWNVQRTESYAQVTIPGRSFDDIRGDQDINRPFRVIGRFDDDELLRIVQLVRSDPPVGNPDYRQPWPIGVGHIQPWPILSVQRRDADSVDVTLRGGNLRGQEVMLRQVGKDWVIVSVAMWIA